MLRIVALGLLAVLLLAACGTSASDLQVTDAQGQPVVTVFKAPT